MVIFIANIIFVQYKIKSLRRNSTKNEENYKKTKKNWKIFGYIKCNSVINDVIDETIKKNWR